MPSNFDLKDNSTRNILLGILLILLFFVLYLLQSILIPLVMAMLFAIMFQPLIIWLQRLKTPKWLVLPTITILTLALLLILYFVIIETSSDLLENKEYLLKRLQIRGNDLIQLIKGLPFVKVDKRMDWRGLIELFTTYKIGDSLAWSANFLYSFTLSFFMFLLYYIVLLSGMSNYRNFLNYVSGEENYSELLLNYERVQRSVYSYMILKSFICLLTGFLTYVICLFYGLNFAFFWGFLTFLLTFIPTIGPILAALPPILMGLIQYDSFSPVSTLAIILIIIKLIMGNIVEPIIMGGKLKINTLTVIFGLVFWGFMWGIAGLILSIPLMVLVKLIFEQIPSLQSVARLMDSPD
jgi:predicted PurR-regulated permease PerM